nr:MAG TPA: hypothetical protein [Microviridae sp.]
MPLQALGYMKFSPDLLKAADYCQHRSFITNRYTVAVTGSWLYEIFS